MYSLSDLIKCDIPMMSYIIFLGNNLLWLKIFEIIQLGYLGHAWSLLVLVWISTLYFIDVNFEPCFSHTKHTFIQKLELHYYQAKKTVFRFFAVYIPRCLCSWVGPEVEQRRPTAPHYEIYENTKTKQPRTNYDLKYGSPFPILMPEAGYTPMSAKC